MLARKKLIISGIVVVVMLFTTAVSAFVGAWQASKSENPGGSSAAGSGKRGGAAGSGKPIALPRIGKPESIDGNPSSSRTMPGTAALEWQSTGLNGFRPQQSVYYPEELRLHHVGDPAKVSFSRDELPGFVPSHLPSFSSFPASTLGGGGGGLPSTASTTPRPHMPCCNTTLPVPEPEVYVMMITGLGMLGAATRHQKKKLAAAATTI